MKHALFLLFALLISFASISQDDERYEVLIDSIRKTARTNLDSSIQISQALIKLGKEDNNTYAIIRGNFFLGYIYEDRKKQPIKGLLYYLNAIKQYELYPSKESTDYIQQLILNTASIYKNISQPEIALDFYAKSLALSEQLQDTSDIVWAKRLMSETYETLNDQQNSYLLIDEGLKYLYSLSIEDQYIMINTAGRIAERFQDYERAERFYKLLLAYSEEKFELDSTESRLNKSFALHNLANLQRKQENYSAALSLYYEANGIKKDFDYIFDGYNMFNSYFDLGECYLSMGNYQQSLSSFNKALLFIDSFTFSSDKSRFKIYQSISDAYTGFADYENASKAQSSYAKYLNNYLAIKEKSAVENQKLNVELITRQYFASVESAETDTTLLWIIVISIGLTLTVGSSIGYNAYQKGRIRKRLETEIKRIQST